MKKCFKCNTKKPLSEFHSNKAKQDGLQTQCKQCHKDSRAKSYQIHKQRHKEFMAQYYQLNKDKYRAVESKRRALEIQAVPIWAEKKLIESVYQQAKHFKFHVDHIVPLKSDIVCGLHCWHNLQLLDPALNVAKSNREWPDMWERHGQKAPRSP